LKSFCDYVGDSIAISNGDDTAVLRENCILNQSEFPIAKYRCRFLNAGPWLQAMTGLSREECISGELPERLGYPPATGIHTGLGDARAIAIAVRHILGQAKPSFLLAG
jgi:hypothetical protein